MMYLGDPPELKEHLLTPGRSKCLEMKKNAEEIIQEMKLVSLKNKKISY